MNVVKVEKNRDYSVISNHFLRDKELSYSAKGLLANVMTHSEQYEFSINGIVATSKEGKTAIYAIIKELIEKQYCTREQDLSGSKFGKVTYTFYESNKKVHFESFEPLSGFPHTVSPDAGVPDTENQPQRSTNIKEVTNIRNTYSSVDEPPDFDFSDNSSTEDLHCVFENGGECIVTIDKAHHVGTKEWKANKFVDFWERYGCKKARAKVEPIFMKLSPLDIEAILSVVDDHKIITERDNAQYRPHPTTWLNQRRWEDDITLELKKYKPRTFASSKKKDEKNNSW